jgi:peroxiredoxin
MLPRLLSLLICLVALCPVLFAQTTGYRMEKIVSRKMTIDENSTIYDKETGRKLPFDEMVSLLNQTPRIYALVTEIDETGKPAYYVLRKRTKEELEAGHPFLANDHKKPEIGQPILPYVMQGADGKTYSSDKLKGKYVLLSFWNKLENPYLGVNQTEQINTLLEKAKEKKVKLVSLGTTLATQEECLKAMEEMNLGFVPIPESTGFKNRYGMFRTPSYLLIGPEGTLLDIVEGRSVLELEKYLVR